MFQAQSVHRENFDPNHVETASLLSIKTGRCPEDCGYCSQSAHYDTSLKATRLDGSRRCGRHRASRRGRRRDPLLHGRGLAQPKGPRSRSSCEMVGAVKGLGMETCVTLGMLTSKQAARRSEAGLDFYNHDVDTSPEVYGKIITTRTLQDRIDTLAHVREAGIKVCCGGIIGMGEFLEDRLGMLVLLANLRKHPESVPINLWNGVKGVPVNETSERPNPIALVRLVATARIMMPKSVVRLAAGRHYMTDELQALCFLAGANSIFIGDVLLTTKNPQRDRDVNLLDRLGITPGLA
ncbi:biotin synthase BioB [Bradyrhizobium sp. CAR08]